MYSTQDDSKIRETKPLHEFEDGALYEGEWDDSTFLQDGKGVFI